MISEAHKNSNVRLVSRNRIPFPLPSNYEVPQHTILHLAMESAREYVPVTAALCVISLLSVVNPIHAAAPDFTQHLISLNADGGFSVTSADIDGDGDIDVISASLFDDKIAWYENDGNIASPGFTEHVVSTNADGITSVSIADIDGDGDLDLLSASFYDKIAWYENDGDTANLGFVERVVSLNADGAVSVSSADVDGDGDIDLLSASEFDDKIAWYENDGSSANPVFTEHVVSTTANGAASVSSADIDGDGDIDLLSASFYDGKISWYENDGSIVNPDFIEHVVSLNASGTYTVVSADVDGDGDIDLISDSTNGVIWYENDGTATPAFTEHFVSTEAIRVRSVSSADVDGDGDIDLLSASRSNNRIAWYENDGNTANPGFAEHVVSNNAGTANSVNSADIDGDGDIDLLSASLTDDKIAWYENDSALKLFVDANQWVQIGLPCSPDSDEATVADLIGDDIPGVLGTDWGLFNYNIGGGYGSGLTLSDPMKAGVGYWLIHLNQTGAAVEIDLPESCSATPVTQPTGCASPNGCFEIPLETSNPGVGLNMLGHAFKNTTAWDRLRILDDNKCRSGCTPAAAEANDVFFNQGWHYNPELRGGAGAHETLSNGSLEQWDGFWVITLKDAVNPRLLIPVDNSVQLGERPIIVIETSTNPN